MSRSYPFASADSVSQILTWHNTYMKEVRPDMPLTTQVYKNVDNFIRRAGMMGYIGENKDKGGLIGKSVYHAHPHQSANAAPVVHAIVTLISQATAPNLLAQMGENFMAWY